ncbi:ABC transporter substrate-binding protein [Scytonema sp. NUACC26]|uniref:ABC transporter substrate-binding protein n=1 Tax=Scytonema sp. NUACC26 TaxID=3140176 RepID=UPI0034DBEA33
MRKLVELTIHSGTFNDGFFVTLQIRENGRNLFPEPKPKNFPPAPDLPELYQSWQRQYSSWRKRAITHSNNQVTNVSNNQSFKNAAKELEAGMRRWFQDQSFLQLSSDILSHVKENESAHIIFKINSELLQRQNNQLLQKLPWNIWNIFEFRDKVWFSLSLVLNQHFKTLKTSVLKTPVKILAIFGNAEGINTQKDKELLENLGAKVELLPNSLQQNSSPLRQQVHDKLWDESWDILFFAGHSASNNEGNSGEIQISRNESLDLNEFKKALKRAIQKGLKLAIFNSCDGMGLANKLAELEISQVIVMRESVPDEVAQRFLQEFLRLFSNGEAFDLAVRQALERLEVIENEYPGASWLPVICQNPVAKLPVWPQSSRLQIWRSHKRKIILVGLSLLFISLSAGIISQLRPKKPNRINTLQVEKEKLQTTPLVVKTQDQVPNLKPTDFSYGGRVLIAASSFEVTSKRAESEKITGIKKFANKNFNSAVIHFQNARNIYKNDPENLIYLNNAKIGEGSSYTIAVPIPISQYKTGAEEILRGVAQAQDEINNAGGINGKPLRVLIADDRDDPKLAKQIAEKLVTLPDVLGVMGHYASNVALEVSQVYEKKRLVVIFPTSSSVKLSNFGNYVFRTVPSDACAGKVLANFMLNSLRQRKAAIFYNSQSEYSNSLTSAFKDAISKGGGEEALTFDLHAPLDLSASVNSAVEKKATVLVLFANTNKLKDALQVLKANDKQLTILGGDDVYNPMTLQAGANTSDIVIAVPWHIQYNDQSEFVKKSRKLWEADVNWRTVTSYDATKALIAGIKQNPTREGVSQALRSKDFTTEGAINEVQFLLSDRRNASIQLVKGQYSGSSSRTGLEYEFRPIGQLRSCQLE